MRAATTGATVRFLFGGAPNETRDHIDSRVTGPGAVSGTFEATWVNKSDGNPYGSVKGAFDVRLPP